jgi:tryprostatin B 6-hydroxylase
MHYYSFDVMGSVAFGHSFDMLTSGKTHSALQQLIDAMRPLGLLTPVPWMFCLLAGLPWLGPEKTPFGKLSIESVAERRKKVLDEPDVMSYLIAEADKAVTPKEKDEATRLLGCESRLIIVAGSDTTASTLTFAFYQLAKNPSLIQNLRTELDPLRQANGDFNLKDLEKAEYLNGVINETLRLHPAVPSGVLRMTPKEGITVGGTYIPGHVTVVTPSWTMGRRADCWVKPLEFLPERWAPDSPLILRKDVFAPFSLGWSSCVGKQLALMELRAVLAYLVCNLDIKMAEGESGERLVEESKDYFTLTLAEFDCVFEERKGVGA